MSRLQRKKEIPTKSIVSLLLRSKQEANVCSDVVLRCCYYYVGKDIEPSWAKVNKKCGLS